MAELPDELKNLSGKALKKLRRGTQKAAAEEMARMRSNVLANRPWWLPFFLWVRIVRIVLDPARGKARG